MSSPKKNALAPRRSQARGNQDGQNVYEATAARLLARLASLDFQCFESMSADVAVPHLAAGPFRELDHVLLEVIRFSARTTLLWGDMSAEVALVLSTAEGAQGEPHDVTLGVLAGACDEGSVPALDNSFVAPLGQWAQDAAQVHNDAERMDARTQAVAHAMAHLLRQRARLRLQAALVNKWGMVATGENARRDARFWMRALLVATGLNRPNGRAWREVGPDLLGEALAVRALLLGLREDLVAVVDLALSVEGEEVGLHLRDLQLRLVELCHASHYDRVRAKDRFALHQLQRRLQDWLAGEWDAQAAARQLLLDVAAFADSLLAVHRRTVLLQHDKEAQSAALALLAQHGTLAGSAKRSPMHELQGLLMGLRWRSGELAMFLDVHLPATVQSEAAGALPRTAGQGQEADMPLTAHNVAHLMAMVRAAL